jgi:hypothetical protein
MSDEMPVPMVDRLQDAERTAQIVGRPVPLLKRVIRPELTFEDAVPGRAFPPLEYRVDADAVRYFTRLRGHWMGEAAVEPSKWVPPLFFADDGQQAVGTQFVRSGRLHTKHLIESIEPVPVGALVRCRAAIANRYERSGRQFIEIECTISLVDGEAERPAVRTRATLLL